MIEFNIFNRIPKWFPIFFYLMMLCIIVEGKKKPFNRDLSGVSDNDICMVLKGFRKTTSYLTMGELDVYCQFNCDFITGYTCIDHTPEDTTSIGLTDLLLLVLAIVHDFLVDLFMGAVSMNDDFLTYNLPSEVYTDIIFYFLPWLLAILPMALVSVGGNRNDFKQNLVVIFTAASACLIHLALYASYDIWSSCFYTLITYQSFNAMLDSRMLHDVMSVMFIVFGLTLTSVVNFDAWAQFFFGFIAIACFVMVFYRKLTRSTREDTMNLVSLILIFKMVGGYMSLLFKKIALQNVATSLIQLSIRAIIPFGGRYVGLWHNLVNESYIVSSIIDADYALGAFILSMAIYLFAFLAIRVVFGLMLLRGIRRRLSIRSLFTALYVYMIDLYMPSYTLFVAIGKRDNTRLVSSLVMCTYTYCEFLYARDFFYLRFLLVMIDYFILETGLLNAQRFMDYNLDFMDTTFHKPGAFPFASIDALYHVSRHVHNIHCELNDAVDVIARTKGVGFIRDLGRGRFLVSVRHVLDQKHRVYTTSKGFDQDVGNLEEIGSSSDPPVQMQLSNCEVSGSSIPTLSRSEQGMVKHLFMVTPDRIAVINDFHFDRHRGDLTASVNLKRGDSGTPIVGVLSDGRLVLVGVVSRGDPHEGSPNLISVIQEPDRLHGSPGVSPGFVEVDLAAPLNDSVCSGMNDIIWEQMDTLGPILVTWPDLCQTELDWNKDDIAGDRWDGFHPEPRGDDDDIQWKAKGKKRVKNWKKNAATRKRRYMELVKALHLDFYSAEIADEAFIKAKPINFRLLRRKGNMRGFTRST
jgi:hypothetical protein